MDWDQYLVHFIHCLIHPSLGGTLTQTPVEYSQSPKITKTSVYILRFKKRKEVEAKMKIKGHLIRAFVLFSELWM